LANTEPAFIDVVCCGGVESTRRALRLCRYAKTVVGLPAMLHITCADMSVDDVHAVLDEARGVGLTNILVERGVSVQPTAADLAAMGAAVLLPSWSVRPPFRGRSDGFAHPSDAIRFIRERFGDHFCVGVMGYPSGVGEYESLEVDLAQLRAKQDAGADFIVAQHVLDAAVFARFLDDAKRAGVTLPIVPSVMPIHHLDAFRQVRWRPVPGDCWSHFPPTPPPHPATPSSPHTPLANPQVNAWCGVSVPAALMTALEAASVDDKRLREVGRTFTVALCRDLIGFMTSGRSGCAPVLHFCTLNLETVVRTIMVDLGLCGPSAGSRRRLPWRPSGDESRASENVRPIYWANRPASYVARTATWLEYPSGRWATSGSGSAAAAPRMFAGLPMVELLPEEEGVGTKEERRTLWGGAPATQQDVWEVRGPAGGGGGSDGCGACTTSSVGIAWVVGGVCSVSWQTVVSECTRPAPRAYLPAGFCAVRGGPRAAVTVVRDQLAPRDEHHHHAPGAPEPVWISDHQLPTTRQRRP